MLPYVVHKSNITFWIWNELKFFLIYFTAAVCDRPPIPDHGIGAVRTNTITDDETSFPVFTKVKYRCERGYSFSGPRTNVCQKDGTWQYPVGPKCLGKLMINIFFLCHIYSNTFR